MRYYLFLVGKGEGCDYTIGCNKTWKMIDAESEDIALDKAVKIINDYDGDIERYIMIQSEGSLTEKVKDKIAENRRLEEEAEAREIQAEEERERQEAEERDRAEFERLKAKFG